MDAVVSQLTSATSAEATVSILKKHEETINRLNKQDLLHSLQIFQQNPIVHCFLLAKLVQENEKSLDHIQKTLDFFVFARGQQNFHLIFESVNILTNYIYANIGQGPAAILNGLYIAVNLVAGPNNDLTFTHQIFMQASIQQKYYDLAYPIAKRPVYGVSATLIPEFKTKQIELYYYYAGIVCAAMKDFANACKLFRFGLIIPGGNFNAIQFDILKKYYIVSLIETGKRPTLSSLTPNRAVEYFRNSANTYIQLATAVEALDIGKVEQVIHEKQKELLSDSNFGLAKQCIGAVKHTRFTRTVETFGSMKFSDLINRTNVENKGDSIETILRLVETGEVQATINEAAETVEFGSTGGGLDAKERRRALAVATQLQDLTRLSKQLNVTNDRLLEEPSVVNVGGKKK